MNKKLLYTSSTQDVNDYVFRYIDKTIKERRNYKFLLVTPTLILFRKRRKDFSYKFRRMLKDYNLEKMAQHVEINEFLHWAKEYVYKHVSTKPLSRSEASIVVKRAVERVYPNSPAWEAAVPALLDMFYDLQATGKSVQEFYSFSELRAWKDIVRVYEEYREMLVEHEQADFYTMLFTILQQENVFSEYDEIIFDGPFLFFKPIHERVIDIFEQQGKQVTFIVPYERHENETAFRVIEKVYGNYVPLAEWEDISKVKPMATSYIEKMRNYLFTDKATEWDPSLQLTSYPTEEQELYKTVKEIKRLVDQQYTSLEKVAIVTPDPQRIRPLVREIADIHELSVDVPERPFLGLSAGDFLPIIYESKTSRRKRNNDEYINSHMFKRIITSGWFPEAVYTVNEFAKIEKLFFTNVVELAEWKHMFLQLKQAKGLLPLDQFLYYALQAVSEQSFAWWIQIIEELEWLQKHVFQTGRKTVQQHAGGLLEGLQQLARKYSFDKTEVGKETLEQLHSITERLETQDRLVMDTYEFSDVLRSLFVGEEGEVGQVKEEPEIMVTGAHNIVFQDYRYIFLVRFTQNQYPHYEAYTWPLTRDIQAMLLSHTTKLSVQSAREYEELCADRERYYFFMLFNSAQNKVDISFALSSNEGRNYPSHYLYDIAMSLGVEEEDILSGGARKKDITAQLEEQGYLTRVGIEGENNAQYFQGERVHDLPEQKEYGFDQLLLYKLCPKRFYYTNQYPAENVYTDVVSFTQYVALELFERSIHALANLYKDKTVRVDFEYGTLYPDLYAGGNEVIEQSKEELSSLFPLSDAGWKDILFYAKLFMRDFLFRIVGDKKKAVPTGRLSFYPMLKEKYMDIETNKAAYTIYSKRELAARVESGYTRTYSLSHRNQFLNISSYERKEGKDEFKDYVNEVKRLFLKDEHEAFIKQEVAYILSDMEKGLYEKKAGNHCMYCPYLSVCLKSNPVEEEANC